MINFSLNFYSHILKTYKRHLGVSKMASYDQISLKMNMFHWFESSLKTKLDKT